MNLIHKFSFDISAILCLGTNGKVIQLFITADTAVLANAKFPNVLRIQNSHILCLDIFYQSASMYVYV